jgi:hypothetical protein
MLNRFGLLGRNALAVNDGPVRTFEVHDVKTVLFNPQLGVHA